MARRHSYVLATSAGATARRLHVLRAGKESERTREAHPARLLLGGCLPALYESRRSGRQRAQPLPEPRPAQHSPEGRQEGGRWRATHSGLGSETAISSLVMGSPALLPSPGDRGTQSPPRGRGLRGLSPFPSIRELSQSHATASRGVQRDRGGQETPAPARKSLTCCSWTHTRGEALELAPLLGCHAPGRG